MSTAELFQSAQSRALRRSAAFGHAPGGLGAAVRFGGLLAIALVIWTAAFGVSPAGAAAALALTAATLLALIVSLADRGDFAASSSVRIARHLQAGAFVTVFALAADAFFHSAAPPLRLLGAGLVVCLYGAAWDLLISNTRALRRPLRVLALGAGPATARLSAAFAVDSPSTVELVGAITLPEDEETEVAPLGDLSRLAEIVEERHIDAVVLAGSVGRLDAIEHCLALPDPPRVLELSQVYERAFGRVPVDEITAAWFLRSLSVSRNGLTVVPRRLVDILLATVLLVLAAPLMLLIALAVRLDSPGPALYRQQRAGAGGRPFTILKFRSMVLDAERYGAPLGDRGGSPRHPSSAASCAASASTSSPSSGTCWSATWRWSARAPSAPR